MQTGKDYVFQSKKMTNLNFTKMTFLFTGTKPKVWQYILLPSYEAGGLLNMA